MKKSSIRLLLIIIPALVCAQFSFIGSPTGGENGNGKKPKKYVAFSTDAEAYFMPRDFEHFQGEFTGQIIKVCEKFDVPFTWLIVVDKKHTEIHDMAEKVFPARRDIDEFSLHVHYKWFIMDDPDDFSSFKMADRRMAWLREAKSEIENAGMPMPLSYRYGGGDSQDSLYYIEDLIALGDEFGVRNYLFSPDRLEGVIGIGRYEHKGNNVWTIDGGRELTLLSTCVYLDETEEIVLTALDERLFAADYAIIGSHDYREVVPANMMAAIEYLDAGYDVEYVTIDRIGELVRKGEIRND
jgi:hypothetical protein